MTTKWQDYRCPRPLTAAESGRCTWTPTRNDPWAEEEVTDHLQKVHGIISPHSPLSPGAETALWALGYEVVPAGMPTVDPTPHNVFQQLVAQQFDAQAREAQQAEKRARVADGVEAMRTFATGATRHTDENKLDFEGFFSPLAWERFAEFMHTNRIQADGQLRSSSNWAQGIPIPAYMKSLWRHVFSVWKTYRGWGQPEDIEEQLCAVIFNAQGALHEVVRKRIAPDSVGHEFGPKTL